jgi:hypothetical protein
MARLTEQALWLIGLVAIGAVGHLPNHAWAGEAKADSDWVFDHRTEAGGAAVSSNNTRWSLGNNDARVVDHCSDPKPQIGDTKANQAGQAERIVKSQCSYSGTVSTSSALGESRMAIVGPDARGFFTVTPRAIADAKADTSFIFTTEAEAEARYGDPVALTDITPDFVIGQTVILKAGATLKAKSAVNADLLDYAVMSLVGFTNVPDLEELYTLSVSASGDDPSALYCSFTAPSSPMVQFVDPLNGRPLSPGEIESYLCRAFSFNAASLEHRVSATTPLFRVHVALGAAGASKAEVGFVGMNTAYTPAVGAEVPPPPITEDDCYNARPGATLSIDAPGVLANDEDPNDLPLRALLVDGPANGTLQLNGDGSFTYRPNPGFVGCDTFSYRAYNGGSYSEPATVTIVVSDDDT